MPLVQTSPMQADGEWQFGTHSDRVNDSEADKRGPALNSSLKGWLLQARQRDSVAKKENKVYTIIKQRKQPLENRFCLNLQIHGFQKQNKLLQNRFFFFYSSYGFSICKVG